MKRLKKSSLALSLLIGWVGGGLLTACSSSSDKEWIDDEEEAIAASTFTINVSGGDDADSSLPAGSNIGLFVIDDGDGGVDNQRLTVDSDGNVVMPTEALSGQAIVYSPYQEDWTDALTTAPRFDVQNDQSSETDYRASDLLIGRAANGTVSLQHVMSKVVIHIVDETGERYLEKYSVRLLNMKGGVTVYLADARVETITDSDADITMHAYDLTDRRLSLTAIVAPQSISADSELMELIYNGSNEIVYIPQPAELGSGQTFTYQFRLTETGIVFDGSSITNWQDGGEEEVSIDN